MVSVELQPASADMMNSSLTDPILSIETFGEVGKDQFLKNKSMIK